MMLTLLLCKSCFPHSKERIPFSDLEMCSMSTSAAFFCKMAPDYVIFAEQLSGRKKRKERIRMIFAANSDRSENFELMFISESI